jgi:hypothetical protein
MRRITHPDQSLDVGRRLPAPGTVAEEYQGLDAVEAPDAVGTGGTELQLQQLRDLLRRCMRRIEPRVGDVYRTGDGAAGHPVGAARVDEQHLRISAGDALHVVEHLQLADGLDPRRHLHGLDAVRRARPRRLIVGRDDAVGRVLITQHRNGFTPHRHLDIGQLLGDLDAQVIEIEHILRCIGGD